MDQLRRSADVPAYQAVSGGPVDPVGRSDIGKAGLWVGRSLAHSAGERIESLSICADIEVGY